MPEYYEITAKIDAALWALVSSDKLEAFIQNEMQQAAAVIADGIRAERQGRF